MLLRLGLHYDQLYRTGALLNITRKRLFTNNDIASLDVVVGDNIRYNFNYYIDKGYYWSVGFNSSYSFFDSNVAIDFIENDVVSTEGAQLNEIELQYSDFTNQLYAETLFKRIFLLGGGIEHKYLRYLSETIGIDENNSPRTVFESTNYFSAFGYLKFDTYDNVFFPKEGFLFEGNFHLYLFAEGRNKDFEPFSIAKAKAGYAEKWTDKLSSVLTTEGGFSLGSTLTESLDFFIGGYGFNEINNIVPFYGYEPLSLRGNTYLKSSLTIDYEIFRKNHINIFGNIAKVGDDFFESGKWIDRIDYSGYGAGYGLETFLGPLEVKYAYSPESGNSEWYFRVGFRF
jgi:NTE family protein